MNILFTNVGRRTYFIDYILQIKNEYKDLNIYLSDCDNTSSALNTNKFTKNILTPKVINNEDNYLSFLKKIILEHEIKLIIPLSDLDLEVLSKNISELSQIGCTSVISSNKLIDDCFNKIKFNKFCKINSLNTPKIIKFNEISQKKMPIIQKKILGSGSNGLKIYHNVDEIPVTKQDDYIFQEIISGQEYHIDILNDLNGKYVSHCIKRKILMRAGETDKAIIIHDNGLDDFAKKLSSISKHVGNLDCDIIVDNLNNIYCIDFNPRFGGGYPFTHLSGMNYLKAIVDNYLGKQISLPNKPKSISASKGISVHIVS